MYNVNISGHHVTVSDEMQSYVKQAIQSLERFSDKITSVNVNVTTEKHDTHKIIAEAKIHIPGSDIVATATADRHLKVALDNLVCKLEKQLRKHKSKVLEKKHAAVDVELETVEEREAQAEFNELAERGVIDA